MEQYNCIIIEDEPLAVEVLRDYIADIPFLVLKNHYNSAVAALKDLNKTHIDLIFLDINLPKLKGIDFIKTLKYPPFIIIISAYRQYALEGFNLNVVDYLLKPIDFNRFLQAVNKLKYHISEQNFNAPLFVSEGKNFIYVYVGKKRVKILLNEIIYIESLKEYVRIAMKDKMVTTKTQLGRFEDLLNKKDFLRIHRSFIISRDKIEAYTSTEIEINGKTLPVGRSYKELVMSMLDAS